ncbi:hypothetical protein [Paraburkholderia sp. BCC1884]|uniref:hypothetical protein n=1 Tax=Paraburkholderia sp. BCC1884 TaxID=2562668 RepID=UPI0011838E0D|nr:hypothetical protein [Paraburkholderia sp. BCC1884]
MKHFFDYPLAERFGYAMAVFIAAEMSDLQRAIDLTNVRRIKAGRRPLEDGLIEDVLSSLRNRGLLPAETDVKAANGAEQAANVPRTKATR